MSLTISHFNHIPHRQKHEKMKKKNESENKEVLSFDKTLTPEELAAPSYFDWSDATLGRYVKSQQKYLVGWKKNGWDKVGNMAACMVMIINARQANAGSITIELSDVTFGNTEPQKWKITVKEVLSKKRI